MKHILLSILALTISVSGYSQMYLNDSESRTKDVRTDPEKLTEILTVRITLTGTNRVVNESAQLSAAMVCFTGKAESRYFTGDVLPGGVDTQLGDHEAIRTLSARYMLKGKDFEGKDCLIFIENNAEARAEYTTPKIITDSECLDFLNYARLRGKLDNFGGGLVIRIYKVD